MRRLIYGILAGLLLAMPAAAQSGSSANTAPSKTSQDQATKTGKDSAAKAGQAASGPARPQAAPAPQAASAPPATKDDSLSNYDVNGSNASDAMGASR